MYTILADLVAVVHLAFVLFVLAGQLLIMTGWAMHWAWTRARMFRLVHLLAIGLVVAQAWFGLWCPLTLLESGLRRAAGEAGYERGFVATWIGRLLYYEAPPWVFIVVYSLFGLLVWLTWWAYPPHPAGRRMKVGITAR